MTPSKDAAIPVPEAPQPRRPYEAPRLVRLGSVRELTLGGSSGIAEGAGTFVMAM